MFTARPRKARVLSAVVALIFVAVGTVVAILLRTGSTGVNFYLSDQVAMVGIGVLLAGGALLFGRPRVRADVDGVEVRNVLGSRRYAWSEIESVSFPDGSPWARLELPEDEYVPMLAVQAIDGEHAVTAMRELRRLRREAGEKAEEPAEESAEEKAESR